MDHQYLIKLLIIFIPFVLAIFLGNLIIPFIILITHKKKLFDPIDSRKLHQRAIPRLGGVSFVPVQCFLLALTVVIIYKITSVNLKVHGWEVFPMFYVLICGLFMLFIVGLADDLIGVSARAKLLVQIFVASLFPLSGLWINDLYGLFFIQQHLSIWIGAPLTIFAVVLIINAVNLIDGLNGLCSGIVMVGCVVLGCLFIYYQAWIHALFAFITVGVLIPFYYYNVFGTGKRRRRIFMGDTGSLTLGYTIAFLSISFAMNNQNIKPFSEGAIVVAFSTLIVPVFDVARVIFIRWRTGKPMFRPDRNHLHHKFLRAGMRHHIAMLSILGLVLFFCIFNVIMVEYISNNVVLFLDGVLWITFHYFFNMIERRNLNKKILSHAL
ncbi:undecaprenyl/decaprenyl-phosphate alpha-N-acetylglucosaminyl 1-phosphate transferase [Sphingobacterium sp. SRCM116780]|uniref:MraY family glycosyltransferase n=1 Tax=Sphingobacterium sp. SRCM116780 TaxID=2907623 RepID=UPI001F1BD59B|nr:MraY family glycosyltransferase [Sphingobacterium sp. SRCM116780]UIR56015.1 undecaprenyl/decaprenyl-phosphate alpha-N-acetylglucosaminyl 1-phosphate transferase [Sphingobacterium sp. SRCM116780]